jgi:hypothetical protein
VSRRADPEVNASTYHLSETKPLAELSALPFLLLGFVPYGFLGYYVEPVRPKKHTTRWDFSKSRETLSECGKLRTAPICFVHTDTFFGRQFGPPANVRSPGDDFQRFIVKCHDPMTEFRIAAWSMLTVAFIQLLRFANQWRVLDNEKIIAFQSERISGWTDSASSSKT